MSCLFNFEADPTATVSAQDLENAFTNLYRSSITFAIMIDAISQTDTKIFIGVSDNPNDNDVLFFAYGDPAFPGYDQVILIPQQAFDGDTYDIQGGGGATNKLTLERLLAHEITHAVQYLSGWAEGKTEAQREENAVDMEDMIMAEAFPNQEMSKPHGQYYVVEGDPQSGVTTNSGDGDDAIDNVYNPNSGANPAPCKPERDADIPNVEDAKGSVPTAESKGDPLVLDLDNSGTIDLIGLANSNVYWDIDEDGLRELSGWVSSVDGLLAIDINTNGRIDDQSELFGTLDTDGFAVLKQYDSNKDGKISEEDWVWGDLIVWRDDNENGYSDESELYTLADFNIVSIDLASTKVSQTNEGHSITHTGTFTVDDGVNPPDTRIVHAVSFEYDNAYSIYSAEYDLDFNALLVGVYLRGYGDVPDLHVAMSLDNDDQDPDSLISLVSAFSELELADLFDETDDSLNAVIDIMYRWAGVDGLTGDERGPDIDARRLEFLEAFVGDEYRHHAGPNPGPVPANDLNEGFHTVLNAVYARLAAQAAGAELFTGDFRYDIVSDSFQGVTGLNTTTLSDLETAATGLSTTAERTTLWENVVRVIDGVIGVSNLSGGDETALDDAISGSDISLDLATIAAGIEYQSPASDTINGTTGDDSISAGADNDTVHGNSGNDTIHGGDDDDVLWGQQGDDHLYGDTGSDYLLGGTGNDRFYWYTGDGHDWILESGSGTGNDDDRIVFGSGIDIDDLTIYRFGSDNLVIEIDNGTVTGSIIVENQFSPGGGVVELLEFSDTSTYSLYDKAYTTYATDGADSIYGSSAGASTQEDTIYGGAGNDKIWANAVNSYEYVSNWLYGEDGNDTLNGSRGDDFLYGGNGNDYLDGGIGDDYLDGGAGTNELRGGTGDDTYIYVGGHQLFQEEGGSADQILLDAVWNSVTPDYFRTGNDMLIVFDEDNTIRITKYFLSSGYNIETMVYEDTTSVDLTTVTYVSQGDEGDNTVNGGSGDDTLYGFAGNDTLNGNDGTDYLDGGAGNDDMNGGLGNDHYYYVSGHDTVYDTGGTEILEIAPGWTFEDLTMYRIKEGAFGSHLIIEINGSNSITLEDHFSNAARTIETLRMNDGSGDIAFSSLAFTTYGTESAETLGGITFGGLNTDTIYGYGGNDTLSGGDGNDVIYGGDGNDTLNGDADDDWLAGEAGDDTLRGGAGNDHYFYESGHDDIRDTGGTEILELASGWTWEDLTFRRFYNGGSGINELIIEIDGSNSITLDDHFASAGSNVIETLRLHDGTGDVTLSSLQYETHGTSGNNTLAGITVGGSINDIMFGHEGNDTLNGNDGDDWLDGGAGNDTLNGGAGNDFFFYGEGLDTVSDTGGTDTLHIAGGVTIDQISFSNVSTYHTKITVTASVDEVQVNNLRHGDANKHVDYITFDDGFITTLPDYASWLWGTSGNDLVAGNANDNTLIGGAGNDEMYGNDGNDAIHGGAGADEIYGGDGDDLIHGGEGDDVIDGGDGEDVLYGGGGADVFVWGNISHGVDTVKDFSVNDNDKLDLRDILTGFNPGTDDILDFAQITDDGTDSTLSIDVNGTGSNYAALAILANVTGLDVEDLYGSGNLLAA